MYKYFKELDNPNDFKIYLMRTELDRQRYRRFKNSKLPEDFFDKHKNVLERLKTIDRFVEGFNEKLARKDPSYSSMPYEEWEMFNEYFMWKEMEKTHEEEYGYVEISLFEKINLNLKDLEFLLSTYATYCRYFIHFFPHYKEFFSSTKKMLGDAINDIEPEKCLVLPKLEKGVTLEWPNAWYITPNGYLYNSGNTDVFNIGKGHKEGSLWYPYWKIQDMLKENRNIPHINHNDKIKTILENGYVPILEFENYANLIYNLPTVLPLEMEQKIKQFDEIKNWVKEDRKKHAELIESLYLPKKYIFNRNILEKIDCNEVDLMLKSLGLLELPETYQPNILILIVGYYAALDCLYHSYARLNDSKRKKELQDKLKNLIWDQDIRDYFIKFSGFHKIETSERKITTASLYAVDSFKNYLDKGWDLYIVPPVVYDWYLDDVEELDFHSYFVNKHFDKVLSEYNGEGRVLIRGINC